MELILICNNFGYGEENTIYYNRTIYWEKNDLDMFSLRIDGQGLYHSTVSLEYLWDSCTSVIYISQVRKALVFRYINFQQEPHCFTFILSKERESHDKIT